MESYIKKSALVAEINGRLSLLEGGTGRPEVMKRVEGVIKGYKSILSFLDTLETKEVDLKKELKTLDNTLFDLDGVAVQGATHYLTVEDVKDIAKRFYELGLEEQIEKTSVDLEKEIIRVSKNEYFDFTDWKSIARHFFELGLKAQKGE